MKRIRNCVRKLVANACESKFSSALCYKIKTKQPNYIYYTFLLLCNQLHVFCFVVFELDAKAKLSAPVFLVNYLIARYGVQLRL